MGPQQHGTPAAWDPIRMGPQPHRALRPAVCERQVIWCDTTSSATALVHVLRVDTGLAWATALRVWTEALRDPALKSTQYASMGPHRETRPMGPRAQVDAVRPSEALRMGPHGTPWDPTT